MTKEKPSGKERRQYPRINKDYILSYFNLSQKDEKIETTQMKNISLGGACFFTTQPIEPGTKIGIELKTPYLSDKTAVEGTVLQSHEKMKDIVYETRLQFDKLNPDAAFVIKKIMEIFHDDQD